MLQIVINVPEEKYEMLNNSKQFWNLNEMSWCEKAILNGIVLPEHSDLIERDALKQRIASVFPMVSGGVVSEVDVMPIIIPATGNEFFNFDAPFVKVSMREGERNADSD